MSADTGKLIAELRAGFEGTTEGPWTLAFNGTGKLRIIRQTNCEAWLEEISGEFERDEDAEHAARCSPDNIRALLDRIASLETALEPFAKHIEDGMDRDNYGEPLPDEWAVGWIYLTYGDFRRAAALSSSKQKDGE